MNLRSTLTSHRLIAEFGIFNKCNRAVSNGSVPRNVSFLLVSPASSPQRHASSRRLSASRWTTRSHWPTRLPVHAPARQPWRLEPISARHLVRPMTCKRCLDDVPRRLLGRVSYAPDVAAVQCSPVRLLGRSHFPRRRDGGPSRLCQRGRRRLSDVAGRLASVGARQRVLGAAWRRASCLKIKRSLILSYTRRVKIAALVYCAQTERLLRIRESQAERLPGNARIERIASLSCVQLAPRSTLHVWKKALKTSDYTNVG